MLSLTYALDTWPELRAGFSSWDTNWIFSAAEGSTPYEITQSLIQKETEKEETIKSMKEKETKVPTSRVKNIRTKINLADNKGFNFLAQCQKEVKSHRGFFQIFQINPHYVRVRTQHLWRLDCPQVERKWFFFAPTFNETSVFWHSKAKSHKHYLATDDICPSFGLCSSWNSFLLGAFLPLWPSRMCVSHWRRANSPYSRYRPDLRLSTSPWRELYHTPAPQALNLTWQSWKAEVVRTPPGRGGGRKRPIL